MRSWKTGYSSTLDFWQCSVYFTYTLGNQSGGRVFLFLHTDDFWRDHEAMKAKGITFIEVPRKEACGTVSEFLDLHGNEWDLIQPLTVLPQDCFWPQAAL